MSADETASADVQMASVRREDIRSHRLRLAKRRVLWGLVVTMATGGVAALAQAPDAQERATALKQSLERSQILLRQYEWIETTAVSVKGEEKSRSQKQCYYGVDGKVQKVEVSSSQPQQGRRQPRGIRGAVAEQKKEELTDYMKSAVALVHQYVPPDPAKIQAAAAKMSIQMAGAGQPARLQFHDYLKAGDLLAIDVDLATNQVRGIGVTSYLDDREDVVALDVRMGVLPDGASYSQHIVLDAKTKDLRVTVDNSGHRAR